MSTPEIIGVKLILEYILESENISLRRKALSFILEFLSVNNLDVTKAEEAMKAEVNTDMKNSNLWIKRIINDLEE